MDIIFCHEARRYILYFSLNAIERIQQGFVLYIYVHLAVDQINAEYIIIGPVASHIGAETVRTRTATSDQCVLYTILAPFIEPVIVVAIARIHLIEPFHCVDIAASHQHDHRTGIKIRLFDFVLREEEQGFGKRGKDLLKRIIRADFQLGILDFLDVIIADDIGILETPLADLEHRSKDPVLFFQVGKNLVELVGFINKTHPNPSFSF